MWLCSAWLAHKLVPQAGPVSLAESMRTGSLLALVSCEGEVGLDQMRVQTPAGVSGHVRMGSQ